MRNCRKLLGSRLPVKGRVVLLHVLAGPTTSVADLKRTKKIEGETYEAYASRVRSMIESALAGMA